MSPKRPIAVVTMVYNEAVMLPVWLRHYARQVGSQNCFVLDHGSDDRSTDHADANVVRLPRTPLNERERTFAVRDFCASLFLGFEHVLYVDADELVVPDPAAAPTLAAYMTSREQPGILDLFGADVLHLEGEAEIDLARPISKQRAFVRPISALCKSTLVSQRVDWHIGFHCLVQEHRPSFGDLYLFHLAYCDDRLLFERQRKRNAAAPIDVANSHHAIDPAVMALFIRSEADRLPRRSEEMRHGQGEFEALKRRLADAVEAKTMFQAPDLWRLPHRFGGAF